MTWHIEVAAANHSSGDLTPSEDDIGMTQRIKAAAAALSIVVHDHIIVGNGRWLSFRKGCWHGAAAE
jgi:DNA repair protein RadC